MGTVIKKTRTSGGESSSKKPLSKMTTRERMLKRKEQMDKKGGGGLNFIKEGTLRIRLKSQGDDAEVGLEVIQFYLGPELGGVISPATFEEPCPLMEKYKSLKESGKEADKDLASLLVPKRRYIIGGVPYADDKGREVDTDRLDKAFMVGRTVYQDIIDLYLDEDEWGDMTDPVEGYDVKIIRSGKGKNDTSYSVTPCAKKALDKQYRGTIDLESVIREQIKSYEDIEEILDKFLNSSHEDEEEDTPKTDKKKLAHKKLVSKKRVSKNDI